MYFKHMISQWDFREVRVARSLVFCVLFFGDICFSWGSCCSIFSFLCIVLGTFVFHFFLFFCWLLCFLSFNLRILITPFVYSYFFSRCFVGFALLDLIFSFLYCLVGISKLYFDFKIISTNEQDKFILR